ncbi:MAG: hypothetical protein Aurels2KO_53610 [Aureliella sp.]
MNEQTGSTHFSRLRVVFFAIFVGCSARTGIAEDSAADLFEQRIVPIFKSQEPSSCVQCHLSSVDLKDYIRPSASDTLRSLRAAGLVDVDAPKQSKILHLIMMGETDDDKSAVLIHKKTRLAEYEAFKQWIIASCQDEKILAKTKPEEQPSAAYTAENAADVAVIRHARKDRVLSSFTRSVWSQRMRCFPCHTPAEIDPNNPKHAVPLKRYREFVAKYGRRMDLFGETPLATMKQMISSSSKRRADHQPLLNFESPADSLLLLKPTAKLPPKQEDGTFAAPSSVAPVSHMGGLKMRVDDLSYKAIITWIADYAKVKQGAYQSADSLPVDNWYPSKTVVRIKNTPESWPKLSKMQIFVYPVADEQPTAGPIAFTQTLIGPRGFAAGNLLVFGTHSQSLDLVNNQLPNGVFEIRVYLDSDGILDRDPSALLNTGDPTAVARVDAVWKEGFRDALVIEGSKFQ